MGEGLWPFFWVALTIVLTGGAAYASTMLMRVIDRSVEQAKQEVLDELEGVEQRLARLELETLPSSAYDEAPRLLDDSEDLSADG